MTTSDAPPIANPRRLLILSPTSQSLEIIPPFLLSLTGCPVTDPPTTSSSSSSSSSSSPSSSDSPTDSTPQAPTTSFAGYTTHPPLQIRNKYYKAEVPVWVDEVPLSLSGSENPTGERERKDADADADADTEKETASASAETWKTEFCSDEARVVRDAIGGIVVCVLNPEYHRPLPSGTPAATEDEARDEDLGQRPDVQAVKDYIQNIVRVKGMIEEERGSLGDVAGMVVFVGRRPTAMNTSPAGKGRNTDDDGILDDLSPGHEEPFSAAWWEEQLSDLGIIEFEVIDWDPRREDNEGRNQFGELQGMRRIKEVLETHDWAAAGSDDEAGLDDELEEKLLGLDGDGFDLEVNELQREMVGLRFAIERGGDDVDSECEDGNEEGNGEDKVEAMETLMLRMQAIKDMSADLPESERRTFAAKAVRDIMREI